MNGSGRWGLIVIAVSMLGGSTVFATTPTPTATCAMSPPPGGCSPTLLVCEDQRCHQRCACPTAPSATPTCPPPPAAPTCAAGTTYQCRDQCRVDCSCAAETPRPSATPTATTTCPPVLPWPDCATDANLACVEYRCGFGCDCACPGDCNRDDVVGVDELITAVRIALDGAPATACLAAVCDCSPGATCAAGVRIDCLVRAVARALDGCAPTATAPSPTPGTPTPPPPLACDPRLNGSTSGPTPGQQIVFRLADESSITLPDGSVESLQGSLLASLCLSPNTQLAARVEALRFTSATVVVASGCAAIGRVVDSTLFGGDTPVEFSSWIRIGGERLGLGGRGPHAMRPGARALDLDLTAGAYRVPLVAIGDAILNPGAEWPVCASWGFA